MFTCASTSEKDNNNNNNKIDDTPPSNPTSSVGASSWAGFTNNQMRDELRKRNLTVSGKKSELIERLNENGISAPPKTTTNTNNTKRSGPAPEWKTSLAKAYLQKQLMDDKSPFHSMTPEQIHKSWAGFGYYSLSNFKSNMKNLMEAV